MDGGQYFLYLKLAVRGRQTSKNLVFSSNSSSFATIKLKFEIIIGIIGRIFYPKTFPDQVKSSAVLDKFGNKQTYMGLSRDFVEISHVNIENQTKLSCHTTCQNNT